MQTELGAEKDLQKIRKVFGGLSQWRIVTDCHSGGLSRIVTVAEWCKQCDSVTSVTVDEQVDNPPVFLADCLLYLSVEFVFVFVFVC